MVKYQMLRRQSNIKSIFSLIYRLSAQKTLLKSDLFKTPEKNVNNYLCSDEEAQDQHFRHNRYQK
jgi:hypothetical protein